jgi:hypothetical protein
LKTRYEELENRYQDLEKLSSMARTVYEPQETIVEKPVYARIGQEVDRLMDMKQSHDKKTVKQLMFYLLYFQGGYSKYMRLSIKCRSRFTQTPRYWRASSTDTSTGFGTSTRGWRGASSLT